MKSKGLQHLLKLFFLEVFIEKEKFNSLINEINKIAKIVEEYDEFIEDFYSIERLSLSTNNYTEKEELNNALELFKKLLQGGLADNKTRM